LASYPFEELINKARKFCAEYNMDLNEYSSKFRVIPFTSLGKENGLLLGIKIDNLQVEYDDQENNVKGAIIGIYNKKLTKTNTYNALIGLDIINSRGRS
ncbi:MAG: sigma-E processing peptidase SpoIIGA, partial [Bacilli bacterium]|nr:sigma-E processing peptidase SpoIIGA [Bacilli bacterium]